MHKLSPAILAAVVAVLTAVPGQHEACADSPSKGLTKIRVAVVCDTRNPVLAYTTRDVRELLESTGQAEIVNSNPDWTFTLQIDPAVPPTAFRVSCDGSSRTVTMSGADASCVSCAAYTALERAGFCFDITGPVVPSELRLDRLAGRSETITPAIKLRGIRQHINFPMDISGYPLAEAKEYIRNLARMRMNFIAFHSYLGQWYELPAPASGGAATLAGGFFYNRAHKIPDLPVLKVVRNKTYYCIPEIEPVFDQPDKRSKAAVHWLQEVMKQAKLAGMTVQLSFEPQGKPVDEVVFMAEQIVSQYPMIDRLELITQEVGGVWDGNAARPVEELKKLIAALFGDDCISDPTVTSTMANGLWQLPGTLKEMAADFKAINELQKRWSGKKRPALVTGVYCTEHGSLRVVTALMRKCLPEGIERTVLSAHGGRAVVHSVQAMNLTAEDAKRTTIYSWTEFDGSMFLQQNSVTSTRQMMDTLKAISPDSQPSGLAFNHWRTAENRTSCRYAALAAIDASLPVERFYRDYGASLGIGKLHTYTSTMQALDDADEQIRSTLGNIGFCFEPCWETGGLGYAGFWGRGTIQSARDRFQSARDGLAMCLAATDSNVGRQYLEFLINRTECTMLHLEAVARLTDLQAICPNADGSKLSSEQRAQVQKIFSDAFTLIERYMDLHAKAIVDRGCEGTLISYFDTLWQFTDRLEFKILGEEEPSAVEQGDAPPPAPAI